MDDSPTFDEALRRQREVFAEQYPASPALEQMQRDMDVMFGQDQAEPIDNYADRRGE